MFSNISMFSPPSITKHIGDESTSLHSILSLDETPDSIPVKADRRKSNISSANNPIKVEHEELSFHSQFQPFKTSNHNHTYQNSIYNNKLDTVYPTNFYSVNNDFHDANNRLDPFIKDSHMHYQNSEVDSVGNYFSDAFYKDKLNLDQSQLKSNDTLPILNDNRQMPGPCFSRLNADRYRAINSECDELRNIPNENRFLNNITNKASSNVLAPKITLVDAFANHIYKVTNQKPSLATINNILSQKQHMHKKLDNSRQNLENIPWSHNVKSDDTVDKTHTDDIWDAYSMM